MCVIKASCSWFFVCNKDIIGLAELTGERLKKTLYCNFLVLSGKKNKLKKDCKKVWKYGISFYFCTRLQQAGSLIDLGKLLEKKLKKLLDNKE